MSLASCFAFLRRPDFLSPDSLEATVRRCWPPAARAPEPPMREHGLLFEVMVYLGAAVVFVPIASRLKLGSVLGYLIAGCAIGPWGLRLVRDVDAIMHFAEFGVVLMLFLIGLELDPKRLFAMRRAVFGGGSLQ